MTSWKSCVNEIGLSAYGPENVYFEIAQDIGDNFLREIMISKSKTSKCAMQNLDEKGRFGYLFEHSDDGFGFLKLKNSHKKSAEFVLKFTLKNIEFRNFGLI